MILEDIESFMKELGNSFSFIGSEYKIRINSIYNYIDENIKKINHNKTIGIIICKENNEYVIKYCSDKRIISREYKIIDID